MRGGAAGSAREREFGADLAGAASAVRLASTTNSRASRSIASSAEASAGSGAAVSVSRARPSRHSKLASARVSCYWPSARSITLRATASSSGGGAAVRVSAARSTAVARPAASAAAVRADVGALGREVAGQRQPQQRPRQQRRRATRRTQPARAARRGAWPCHQSNQLHAQAFGRHHGPPMRSRTPAALLAASAGAPAALSRASSAPSAAASSGASSSVQAPPA